MNDMDTALFFALWEQMPHLIVVLDGEGRIRTLTPALARQLGLREADLRGRPIAEILRDIAGTPWPRPGAVNPWWRGQLLQFTSAGGAPIMMRVDRVYEMPYRGSRYRAMSLQPVREWRRDGGASQHELDAIAEVSSAVCQAHDPDAILRSALDKAIEMLNMDAGIVGLIDRDQNLMRVVAHHGRDPGLAAGLLKLGPDTQVINTVLMTGQPLLIPDLANTEISSRALPLGYRAIAAAPIILRGATLGAMTVGAKEPREFDHRAENLLRIMGMQVTIAVDHAQLLEQDTRRARELEAAVHELHHRVKNNLETLSAMLEFSRTEGTGDLVDRLLQRVEAMAAAHELMKDSAVGDQVEVGELVTQVATLVGDAAGDLKRQARVTIAACPCVLPGRLATPLALITGELISNALRHAFAKPGGEVKLSLSCGRGKVRLSVADNGVGIRRECLTNGRSMGLRIVHALVEHSLGGALSIQRRKGTCVTVSFPFPADGRNETRRSAKHKARPRRNRAPTS